MKAVVFTRYGSPDVLRLQDMAKPEPKDDEVLVKIHASAVNDWDWCYVRGMPHVYRLMYGLMKPGVSVLGAEVSGTVEAVGKHITRFQPGDDVYGDLSEAGFGGFAEYVCATEDAFARKPPGMTFEMAAALPHASMLAFQGLVDVGQIRQGESVLINGAGGGVGTVGVQIAKQFGAEVTGVDSSLKLNLLRSLGFDHIIDYQREDFTRNGRRYNLILDTKTTRSPLSYLRSLKADGRYVTVGGNVSRLLQSLCMAPLVSCLSDKQIRIVALKPNKDLGYVSDLFERGGLECVIDGPYPLNAVPQALQRFGEAKHLGKIVITIAPEERPPECSTAP